MFVRDKSWCIFNMVTPDLTLVLLLQWQLRASDLKLYHTLLTAQFGTVLILVVRSSQETSQRNSFHMWWSSSCCGKMVYRTAWKVLQWRIKKKLAQHWQGCRKQEGECMELWGIETEYTLRVIFYVLFCSGTLSWSKYTNMRHFLYMINLCSPKKVWK